MQFCGWWGLPLLTEWKLKLAGSLKFLCFPSPGGFGHKNINCLSVQCVCLFFLDIQTYRHCPHAGYRNKNLFSMQNAEWVPSAGGGCHSCGVEIGARGLAKIFMFSLGWWLWT